MKRALTCGLLAVVCLAARPFAGQQAPAGRGAAAASPPYRAPRLDGHPDLNGIWQAFVTANWDVQGHEAQAGPHPEIMGAYGAGPAGQSIVEGGEIPYQPWALAKKKKNFDERMKVDVTDDKKWHALGDPELNAICPGCRARRTCRFHSKSFKGRRRTS